MTLPQSFLLSGRNSTVSGWSVENGPALGRFLQPDPLYDGPNRYMYVHGNPVRYVDPSGMKIVEVSPGAFLDDDTGLPVDPADIVEMTYHMADDVDADGNVVSHAETELLTREQARGYYDMLTVLRSPRTMLHIDNPYLEEAIRYMLGLSGYVGDLPTFPPGASLEFNVAVASSMSIMQRYNLVRNGGAWNYKQQGSEYEDFGILNYGASGTALRIPPAILLRGAGWANQVADPENPERRRMGSPLGDAPYGDDPADIYWIVVGINYAEWMLY
jgi:hypothetical protein